MARREPKVMLVFQVALLLYFLQEVSSIYSRENGASSDLAMDSRQLSGWSASDLGGHTNETVSRRVGKSRGKSGNRTSLRRPKIRRIIHPSTHAAWDDMNHLCALAKFQATFTIKYETFTGTTSQLIDKMPADARSRGRCDQFDDEPVLDIFWKDTNQAGGATQHQQQQQQQQQQQNGSLGFTLRIIFQKFNGEEDDRWGVQQMQLLYNTGHPIFRGVAKAQRFIVRSRKDDYRLQFRTSFGRSLLCPSPPPIQMYDSDGVLRVIARLSNMQLQAFEFDIDDRSSGHFDAFERCGQVSFGSGVARQALKVAKTDGLTWVIGIITVCIATLTVVGYAIYRSNALKTKQYKTMDFQ